MMLLPKENVLLLVKLFGFIFFIFHVHHISHSNEQNDKRKTN